MDYGATGTGSGTIDAEHFEDVFRTGRTLHVKTKEGFHMFTTVVSASTTGNRALVTVAPAIPVPSPCLNGDGSGTLIAPITRVRYEIRQAPAGTPGASRNPVVSGINTQLIRSEFEVISDTPVGAPRVVLNYAVDFNLDFYLDLNSGTSIVPRMELVPGATAAATLALSPWQARSIVVSLAARTAEQDPRFAWPTEWGGGRPLTEPLNRYRFSRDRPGAARVRSLRSEIMLPNLLP